MKITSLKCLNIINLSTMVRVRFENYLSEMYKMINLSTMEFTVIVGTICLLASLERFVYWRRWDDLASLRRFVYWRRWEDLFIGIVGTICLLASLGRFVY